jgi:hypothetical protein
MRLWLLLLAPSDLLRSAPDALGYITSAGMTRDQKSDQAEAGDILFLSLNYTSTRSVALRRHVRINQQKVILWLDPLTFRARQISLHKLCISMDMGE